MEFIIGAIVVMGLVILFSKLKQKNQELNDYYPFTDKGDLK